MQSYTGNVFLFRKSRQNLYRFIENKVVAWLRWIFLECGGIPGPGVSGAAKIHTLSLSFGAVR